jgi:hypothetical protein
LSHLDIEDSVEWDIYLFLTQKLNEVFMFHPALIQGEEFPVDLAPIACSQRANEEILLMKKIHPGNF